MVKIFFCSKQISKRDTCSTSIFQGLFKNIVFRSVASVIKKLWTFYRPVLYPMIIKRFTKNPLNNYLLKVKKFHGDSVKNESAIAKQLEGGVGARRPTPPPSLLRVNKKIEGVKKTVSFIFQNTPTIQ